MTLKKAFLPLLLFIVALSVVLQTTAPTIYYLADSTEYAIGAKTLGIVHAPGYALYTMIAHLFTYLPIGDLGYRVNLFSSVSLAFVALFTYGMLGQLIDDKAIAFGVALSVVWSFHIWVNAVAAEVYIPQLAALSATGWALVALHHAKTKTWGRVLGVGALYGLAAALNPTSILFAPGMVAALLLLRVPLLKSTLAGGLAAAVVLPTLLYFPVRYAAGTPYNVAGVYGLDGEFHLVNLTTVSGVWWLVSGRQFESLFFAEGYIPTAPQLYSTLVTFWGNYLGLGLILAVVGLGVIFTRQRALLAVWLIFFMPFTYFFITYGASDRDTMFSPALWLLSIPIAYSLLWFLGDTSGVVRWLAVLVLPAAMLVMNFQLVDASDTYFMRERAAYLVEQMPQDALVFGSWTDATMLQYMQLVEGKRPDLRVVNLFFFNMERWQHYMTNLAATNPPPIVLIGGENAFDEEIARSLQAYYEFTPLDLNPRQVEAYQINPLPDQLTPHFDEPE